MQSERPLNQVLDDVDGDRGRNPLEILSKMRFLFLDSTLPVDKVSLSAWLDSLEDKIVDGNGAGDLVAAHTAWVQGLIDRIVAVLIYLYTTSMQHGIKHGKEENNG